MKGKIPLFYLWHFGQRRPVTVCAQTTSFPVAGAGRRETLGTRLAFGKIKKTKQMKTKQKKHDVMENKTAKWKWWFCANGTVILRRSFICCGKIPFHLRTICILTGLTRIFRNLKKQPSEVLCFCRLCESQKGGKGTSSRRRHVKFSLKLKTSLFTRRRKNKVFPFRTESLQNYKPKILAKWKAPQTSDCSRVGNSSFVELSRQ